MITHLSSFSGKSITLPVTVRNIDSHLAVDIDDALWDTGSAHTIITKDIAKVIGIRLGERGEVDTPKGAIPCWRVTFEIKMSDGGIFELEDAIVLDNELKRHVVIGMDIIGSGISRIDVVEEGGKKFFRLVYKCFAEK